MSGGGASGRAPFRDHLDYLDRQITLLGTGGLLTMLTEAGSGTLAGSAHSEAFRQVALADAVLVAEALRRDFDAPLLAAAFPGWPIEAGFVIEAAGWITALEARADGLWAKIRRTDAGLAAATGGRYRLVSPVFPKAAECEDLGDDRVRPRKLVSVALTNEPNIRGGKPIANRFPLGGAGGSGQLAVGSAGQRKREEAMRGKLDNRWSNAARAASLAVRQAKAAARKKAATGTQAARNNGPPQIWPHGWWRREKSKNVKLVE